MRKRASLSILGAALLILASCATTPPQKPQPEAPPPEKSAAPEAPAPEKPAVPAPDAELAQAKSLQEKVDGYGLAPYDPDDYATATQSLKAGQDAYGKDNASAKQSLQASIDAFNAVLAKGGPLMVGKMQDQSAASKKAADDLKASVAVKDDYAKANAVYQNALKEKDAGDLKAGADFASARDMFDAVTRRSQQKKDAALQALRAAEQDRTASEQKAAAAQKALQDEGITTTANGQ
jgi:hypothetical protein